MNWALGVIAVYCVLSGFFYISMIGKPREPITPAMAVIANATVLSIAAVLAVTDWRLFH